MYLSSRTIRPTKSAWSFGLMLLAARRTSSTLTFPASFLIVLSFAFRRELRNGAREILIERIATLLSNLASLGRGLVAVTVNGHALAWLRLELSM
jgi:hypothetical protein